VLLVTEPTPFGLNDLKLAVSMTRELGLPMGIVINRCDVGDKGVEEYCSKEGIRVFLKIPDDKKIAKAYSKGYLLVDALPGYAKRLNNLFIEIAKEVGQ
jgi:MinD superfamily P-loop ATPase